MDEIVLGVPESLLESLPDDDGTAARDMQRAVEGYNEHLERLLDQATDENAAIEGLLDVVDHFESRGERYDEFVPELRAWGQSPIYAITWRNLYADLIAQLYDHDDVADALDRERNARLVADGIRLSDL